MHVEQLAHVWKFVCKNLEVLYQSYPGPSYPHKELQGVYNSGPRNAGM